MTYTKDDKTNKTKQQHRANYYSTLSQNLSNISNEQNKNQNSQQSLSILVGEFEAWLDDIDIESMSTEEWAEYCQRAMIIFKEYSNQNQ